MKRCTVWFSVVISTLVVASHSYSQASRVDFRFDFLKKQAAATDKLDVPVPATIRYVHAPDQGMLDRVEQAGIHFQYFKGQRLGSSTVFPVQLTFNQLDALGADNDIAAIQPAWRPAHVPPLDVSRPQIQADTVWQQDD